MPVGTFALAFVCRGLLSSLTEFNQCQNLIEDEEWELRLFRTKRRNRDVSREKGSG